VKKTTKLRNQAETVPGGVKLYKETPSLIDEEVDTFTLDGPESFQHIYT
jgi:hypothetical protein